jgi:predicted ATPase/DNA-binding winged helix-turn-helix (wHTH) protein
VTDDSPAPALVALRTGDALIDLRSCELLRAGERVHVEPQVFDVIRYLAEHAGRVVLKEELLDNIWGTRFVSESSLTTRIKAARRAFGDDGREQHVIQTVHGRGYRWVMPVEVESVAVGAGGFALAARPVPEAAQRSALPVPLTAFIGRRHERAALLAAVRAHRLVTASGPGGTGKTRLALAVATALRDELRDGVAFVDLVEVTEESMVVAAIADAAGITEQAGTSRRDALHATLATRECLLVVDNCEHLLDAARGCIGELLLACPDVRVLATSRIRLMLPYEHVYAVPGLSLDDDDTGCSDAEALFTARMAAAGASPASDPATRASIRDICRALDGVALAIELAAARVPSLGLDGLSSAFGAQVPLLTIGRSADHRHHSLRAAIDWTYQLLDEDERTALRAAAVFAVPFGVDALAITMRRSPNVVLGLVARLVDWNLAERVIDRPGRYRVLESIRQFAAERADAAGESDALHAAHFDWVRATVEALGDGGVAGPGWYNDVDLVLPEARAALHWAIGRSDQRDAASFAGMLAAVCYRRGHPGEAQQRFQDAATVATDVGARHRWLRLAAGAAAARNVGADALDLLAAAASAAVAAGIPDEAAIDLAAAAMYCHRAQGIIARPITENDAEAYLTAARGASTGASAANAAIAVAAAWRPEAVVRSVEAAEHALALTEAIGDPVMESAALDLVTAARLDDDLDVAAAAARRRRELLAASFLDARAGFEIYDAYHMSCQIDLARGDFSSARHHADAITRLPFFREARHVGLCRRMEVDAMSGDFDVVVRHGALFEQDWNMAGRPGASNLAVGCYAVAMAQGILGALVERAHWIDIATALVAPTRRAMFSEPGWGPTLDALFDLHRGDAESAMATLMAAPDDPAAWDNPNRGLWRRWYAAAWAEASVLANHHDAAERVRRAERIARGNHVAELLVDRARLVLQGNNVELYETADHFDRLGARYQSSRSLRLANDLTANS